MKIQRIKRKERLINFLYITIKRETNKFNIDIYRKPTYTDASPLSTLKHEYQGLPSLNNVTLINQNEYRYICLLIMNYQLINH